MVGAKGLVVFFQLGPGAGQHQDGVGADASLWPGGFELAVLPDPHYGDAYLAAEPDLLEGFADHRGFGRRGLGDEQLVELADHVGRSIPPLARRARDWPIISPRPIRRWLSES